MSAPTILTHPLVRDGWFTEVNSQWPGQGMSLQVSRILHHEQSKFQDVLVFESTTYGNVLVLDGVIQATERDEFSYQEMIAHLPLASHPNPERVLVIGGGDGGVLREVVKHPSVKEVILCDIDEAVPRVSAKYLPKMAAGLHHPKVKVIIGDGFEFLQRGENQQAFDTIITDSSDPVGPAEALFQPPFFKLLKNALREGGHISTQAESMWIHLNLIREIRQSVNDIFPVADYAFTTIPTYPCGQIGFVVASLKPNEDLRQPLREVSDCRYWSPAVHKAAFTLPEFARKVIEDGEQAPPRVIASGDGEVAKRNAKKVLLLGSGYVARPFAEYITRYQEYSLTVSSSKQANADKMAEGLPRTKAQAVNVQNPQELEAAVAAHDVVISLVPYIYHVDVIKAAMKSKTNVVTTSYVSDAIRELEPEIKKSGITVVNEIGLDPGLDHLYAVKAIHDIHADGGKITSFTSYCGGLPAPEAANNPLGYKFSWSSRGVLLALRNTGVFWEDGEKKTVAGIDLMQSAKPLNTGNPAFNFVCYPNRDSSPYREWYGIPEAQTVIRGTMRYGGFPELVLALVRLGFLDDGETAKEWLKTGSTLSWPSVVAKLIGAQGGDKDMAALQKAIESKVNFKSEYERSAVLQGMRWLGFFDTSANATVRGLPQQMSAGFGNPLDTLCATLEQKCAYADGERDMVMLQHRFEVTTKSGEQKVMTSSLLDYGHPMGHSSMARLVGVPCGVATRLLLEGDKSVAMPGGGIWVPYTEEACKPLRDELAKEGIALQEKWV
ncbi:putative chimeric spermidine synthase/saccharopine reductase [Jaminaea rosea]|uniref:Putative chimeric spermidine synthase/saccharopine reductase n=1 Tax=Jaminaea rosea TaxID=1569628 RepID=A0A316V0N0_9BASI|nr:putative chimeric spermidine synthase/saccharopine reductase [Jaminaea rosea]PWN31032.1 putative chimeric spermidine synthase/saccharopine reductase [Jaminaea rosea]